MMKNKSFPITRTSGSTTTSMNFIRSSILQARVSVPFGIRAFSNSTPQKAAEKYWKITRYAKPIDKTIYKEGDQRPNVPIPYYKPTIPEYEYEPLYFKRQNRGLYGGLQRSSSKSCSKNGKNKNLRTHLPHIVNTTLWSETLQKSLKMRVATRVLKTIDKEGGLDNYLTKDKPARVKTLGLKGWQLRFEILKLKELEELGQVDGKQVYYVHDDGKKITVGRKQLLKELFPLVYKDNYYPIDFNQFLKSHTVLTTKELVDKLHHYNYDFSQITI